MSGEYLLVTPAKNEADNLPGTIESIIKQIRKPLLWIIVDDGSTDDSEKIVENAISKYPSISLYKLPQSKRDIGFHYSDVCREGFSRVLEMAHKMNLKCDYIALLDADMRPEPNYFNFLIQHMDNDKNIGISSGGTWSQKKNTLYQEKQRKNLPSGGARIWRYKCFTETGGYEHTMAPDSISNARAHLRGWKTVRFEEIRAIQSRPVSSAEGVWVGYKKRGEFAYYLNSTLIFTLGKSIKQIASGNVKSGIAIGIGYMSSFINRKPKIEDEELAEYFKKRGFGSIIRGD